MELRARAALRPHRRAYPLDQGPEARGARLHEPAGGAHAGQDTVQRQRIIDLCARPKSVAEVAALLSVPLGVARVLVGDLASDGSVVVHAAVRVPDVDLMQRVLVGLRRL